MEFKDLGRRAWRMRTSAIRNVVDQRQAALSSLSGPLADREKIDREAANRILRAQGSGTTEGK